MAATSSSIPAVLDALFQRWSLALPDAQVTDGQPLDMDGDDVICVGFTGTPNEVSVTSTRTREHMSADPDREQYDVVNMVSSWRGREPNAKVVRDALYALIDAMNDALVADQTLGGLVMRAQLATANLAQWQTNDGATTVAEVTVHVDGFTRR